jgi:hypothetical protein
MEIDQEDNTWMARFSLESDIPTRCLHDRHLTHIVLRIHPERLVDEARKDFARQYEVCSIGSTFGRTECKPGMPTRASNSSALKARFSKSCSNQG